MPDLPVGSPQSFILRAPYLQPGKERTIDMSQQTLDLLKTVGIARNRKDTDTISLMKLCNEVDTIYNVLAAILGTLDTVERKVQALHERWE